MKATFQWKQGVESIVNNNRGHEVIMDLPQAKNGTDNGATAIEFCAMSLVGCIGTIFAVMAAKMRFEFSELEIELDAAKTDADKTITEVVYQLKIKTEVAEQKVKKCLELTEENCPVGQLFNKANIPVVGKIVML